MSQEMRLLVGTDKGLFSVRTTDDGGTWGAPEAAIADVDVATIQSAPDGSFYVGTRDAGLFRSGDRLRSWEHVETPPGLAKVRSLCIGEDRFLAGSEAAAEAVGVYEWLEAKHWRRLGDMSTCSGSAEWHYPVPTEGVHLRHLARDPHQPERIYAAIQVGGVGISPDGGYSWYDRRNLDCDVHMVEGHPRRPGVVFAGSGGGGLYRSADYGDSWECVSEGCGNFVVQFALDPSEPDRVYLGTARGGVRQWREDPDGPRGEMFRSDDSGATWRKLAGGLPEHMRARVNAITLDTEEPHYVFFSGGHSRGEPDGWVHFSPDAGETWRTIAPIDEGIALSCVRM